MRLVTLRRLLLAPVALALLALASASLAQPAPAPAPKSPTAAAATAASPVQDPAALSACLSRFSEIGVPRHRGDGATPGLTLCRRGYALFYNLDKHNPDWVIERLTPVELKGKAVRSNNFQADPLIAQSAVSGDFDTTGFDRGHQAPAGDDRFDQQVMNETFYMSNMSPQVGIGFNRGQWKYLEEAVRAWVLCGGRPDVIVMTGPIYGDSKQTISARKIAVPQGYYKILYDVKTTRAVGFKLLNQKYAKTDLQTFIVPIAQIEDETGLDFFAALNRRKQTQLETPKGLLWGHDQACANAQGE